MIKGWWNWDCGDGEDGMSLEEVPEERHAEVEAALQYKAARRARLKQTPEYVEALEQAFLRHGKVHLQDCIPFTFHMTELPKDWKCTCGLNSWKELLGEPDV